ncbi:VOC family protein [Burkholderiaceae bacterium UC74_6]
MNLRSTLRSTAATFGLAALAVATASPSALADEAPGHVTGIGGIFFKAKDPKALVAWYHDVLGLQLEAWGGAALRYDAPKHPPAAIWGVFSEKSGSGYFAPSTNEFMINYAVDDMDAFVTRLKAKGVEVLKRTDDATGRFAWIVDPEGHKIELWEPKPVPPAAEVGKK